MQQSYYLRIFDGRIISTNKMAEELLGYDDQEAVKYIRNYIPQELKELVTDDDIIYFVDLIYDFYESRGFFDDAEDECAEEEAEFDDEELLDYVVKNARKDEIGQFDKDQIRFIVQGEMAYSESIGLIEQMGKNKLAKFAQMEEYAHVFQYPWARISQEPFPLKGKWCSDFFHNDNPIVLELGCGKGEYAVGLARRFPDKNFIGIDIKGARMWTGAKISHEEGLSNVAFLRTEIELLEHFFAEREVDEIWITFADPQMKKVTKRLTGTRFIERYLRLLKEGEGLIHLKTDSPFLYTYTKLMAELNEFPIEESTDDLYAGEVVSDILDIKTYYEQQWIQRGKTIKYLRFRSEHPTGKLVEPEVEIEFDDYRSFGRDARSKLSSKESE